MHYAGTDTRLGAWKWEFQGVTEHRKMDWNAHWSGGMTGVVAEAVVDGQRADCCQGPDRVPCRLGQIAHIIEDAEAVDHVHGSAG